VRATWLGTLLQSDGDFGLWPDVLIHLLWRRTDCSEMSLFDMLK